MVYSSRATDARDVGPATDSFPPDGEDDFHVRARSKLRVNQLQFVHQEALAHRSHDEGPAVEARSGPPAIMPFVSWERRQRSLHVSTSTQQVYDQRVSATQVVSEGEFGEEDNAEELLASARDRMRADMRFSRTSAAIASKVFTEVLQNREAHEYERISTVRVEETAPPRLLLRRHLLLSILLLGALQVPRQWKSRWSSDRRSMQRSESCAMALEDWAVAPFSGLHDPSRQIVRASSERNRQMPSDPLGALDLSAVLLRVPGAALGCHC